MIWQQARVVVDTGAKRTALTVALAARLKLPQRGKRLVRGARGENMHALFDFEIGFLIKEDAGARPLFLDGLIQGMEWAGHPEFEVLLGMDVLSRCDLSLRRDQSFSLVVS